MKKLYFKLFLFLSPFIINTLLIVIVDPYNFLGISHVIPNTYKMKCIGRTMETTPRGNICWKILEYERNPKENILIGDSRMVHIDNSLSEKIMGEEVYNFSVPGANFRTLNDIFWEAAKNKDLKRAYLQVGFLNFSKNVTYDLMESLNKYRREPFKYFYDKDIIGDTWVNIYYYIAHDDNYVDINFRERDVDLWSRAQKLADGRLARYEYPTEFEIELKKISEYCKKNNIELYFILLPTQKEFTDKVVSKGLEDEYAEFNAFVRSLGNTISFEQMQQFTSDRANFKDYFHYHQEMLDSITCLLWQKVKIKNELSSGNDQEKKD